MSKMLEGWKGKGEHLKAGLTDAPGTPLRRRGSTSCSLASRLSILNLTPLLPLLLLPVHSDTDADIWIAGGELSKYKKVPRQPYPPWKSGHAEVFRARRLRMVAEGDSPHSHRAWRHNQEWDSWVSHFLIGALFRFLFVICLFYLVFTCKGVAGVDPLPLLGREAS